MANTRKVDPIEQAQATTTASTGVHLWLLLWKATKGSTLIQRLFAEQARDMEQAFSCLDGPEKKALATLLHKIGSQADEAGSA